MLRRAKDDYSGRASDRMAVTPLGPGLFEAKCAYHHLVISGYLQGSDAIKLLCVISLSSFLSLSHQRSVALE